MGDKIRVEVEDAVEGCSRAAPAPGQILPLSPASRPGASPCGDWIDELVDASLATGPVRPKGEKCPHCGGEWHGKPNAEFCQGSHLASRSKNRPPKRSTTVRWDRMKEQK